jgi:hypothetical protein
MVFFSFLFFSSDNRKVKAERGKKNKRDSRHYYNGLARPAGIET